MTDSVKSRSGRECLNHIISVNSRHHRRAINIKVFNSQFRPSNRPGYLAKLNNVGKETQKGIQGGYFSSETLGACTRWIHLCEKHLVVHCWDRGVTRLWIAIINKSLSMISLWMIYTLQPCLFLRDPQDLNTCKISDTILTETSQKQDVEVTQSSDVRRNWWKVLNIFSKW